MCKKLSTGCAIALRRVVGSGTDAEDDIDGVMFIERNARVSSRSLHDDPDNSWKRHRQWQMRRIPHVCILPSDLRA